MWNSQQRLFIFIHFLSFQRPGSNAQPHLFWWFTSQTHSESLGNVSDVTATTHFPGEPLEGTDEARGRCSWYTLAPLEGLCENFACRTRTKCLWLSMEVQHSQIYKRERKTWEEARNKKTGWKSERKRKRVPRASGITLKSQSQNFLKVFQKWNTSL